MRKNFLTSQDGATAIEYGMICAMIILAIIVALTLVGNETANSYTETADKIENAMSK